MNAIYEPRGAAAEYAPLACNLYRGCGHGCSYCYAPSCLRLKRAEFDQPAPRKDVLTALAKDAAAMRGDSRPVLLSFTSDPYQPIEREFRLTRRAIGILADNGLLIRLLTKGAALAMEDLPLFCRAGVEVGVTLLWADDDKRRAWEPGASTISQRVELLRAAHAEGLRTWVSVEPVIEPAEALAAIGLVAGIADTIKVGKINHNAELERAVDWRKFRDDAAEAVKAAGAELYVKHDLVVAASRS